MQYLDDHDPLVSNNDFLFWQKRTAPWSHYSPDSDFIPPARFAGIHQLVGPLDCDLDGVPLGNERSPN